MEYEPLSPLHLHIDAIEIAALADDFRDVPWAVVKCIGAERIMEILTDRWCPRHGTVCAQLSSDMWLTWQGADEDERRTIRANCARFKPDLFQYFMEQRPCPNWEKAGSQAIMNRFVYLMMPMLTAPLVFVVQHPIG